MTESVKLIKKQKTELPVYVVEDHNEALKHIYREIGRKRLPMDGFPFIHFDSHPDLLIPKNLDPQKIMDKEHVFDSISIENWIMPAIFAGHLSEVAWIKPPWATKTIPNCSQEFHIGVRQDTQQIRVSCPQSYFVSELLYAPRSSLQQAKASRLTVFSLGKMLDAPNPANSGPEATEICQGLAKAAADEEATSLTTAREMQPEPDEDGIKGDLAGRLKQGEGDAPCRYALDIDLDFYSTKNPFLQEVGEKILEILKELYYFKMPKCETEEDIERVTSQRQRQLEELQSKLEEIILNESYFTKSRLKIEDSCSEKPLESQPNVASLQTLSTSEQRWFDLREAINEFWPLEESRNETETDLEGPHAVSSTQNPEQLEDDSGGSKYLRTKDRRDLPEYLHEVGCTCDETPLPHHVSSQEQIDHLVQETKNFLKTLPKPAMVTLARSSLDEYCPQEQVNDIQNLVLKMLEELYGSLNVTLDY